MKDAGRLYPCFETQDELERKRRLQIARGAPPVYDRAALKLTEAERAAFAAEGRKPHWRFKLTPDVVRWDDLIRGDSHIDCASLSDPVLVREDGSYLYTLPSVVDDIDAGVTHIIRGEDHVTNTAVQIQLFPALGAAAAPQFAHHNLLIGADGQGLSKRSGALSIAGLREAGSNRWLSRRWPCSPVRRMAVQPVHSLPELAGLFDLVLDFAQQRAVRRRGIAALSQHVLHGLSYDSVRDRLEALEIVGRKAEPLWLAARGNLEKFSDISHWWRVIEGADEKARRRLSRRGGGRLAARASGQTGWGVWTQASNRRPA